MTASLPGRAGNGIPELLAPAGSVEAFRAALAAGADAVYLGGCRFGARQFADNFTIEEIREAIRIAHRQGVKIYVTVNTLIHDWELIEAAEYILSLYSMGADAILLQDIGLAFLAHSLFPDLSLHASTQCTLSSPEGVRWAGNFGFSRVVLARELTPGELGEILSIPRQERPGIEVFLHGALCYSYSGQCLLSSVIGGRSGNRGMCAQPCRKPYRFVTGSVDEFGRMKTPKSVFLPDLYLLSTKDLCAYPHLMDLPLERLESLKIEGRMRSPMYVAIVVAAYRKALLAIRKGDWHPSFSEVEEMALEFSRGFTGGHLCGERGAALMGRSRPDNRGLLLGKVVRCSNGERGIFVRRKAAWVPSAGDGLVLVDPISGNREGLVLKRSGELRGNQLFLPSDRTRCRPGWEVYLTGSRALQEKAEAMILHGSRRWHSRIPVDLTVEIESGQPPTMSGKFFDTSGGEVEVRHIAGFVPLEAQTQPLAEETIIRHLKKTRDSLFSVRNLDLRYPGGLFIPLSELNRMRREFFQKAEEKYDSLLRPSEQAVREAAERVEEFRARCSRDAITTGNLDVRTRPPEVILYVSDPVELRSACEAGADAICFEPVSPDWEDRLRWIREAVRLCGEHGIRFAWKWPRITSGTFLNNALPLVPVLFQEGVDTIMVDEPGISEAICPRALGVEIRGGMGLNIFNHLTVRALSSTIRSFCLSPEISGNEIRTLIAHSRMSAPGIGFEVICQGNLEAMVTRDPLLEILPDRAAEKEFSGLQDSTGRIFPFYADGEGRTRILNAVETCLVDRLPDLLAMGVNGFTIDARGRGPGYVSEMTAIYREGLDLALREKWDAGTGQELKGRVRAIARGGITSRHYLFGLGKPPGRTTLFSRRDPTD